MNSRGADDTLLWPEGNGGMAAHIRAYDWATTPLGPIDRWPQSLKTVVDLMLASPGMMSLVWGAEAIHLYNDAFTELLREHHVQALGRSAFDTFARSRDVFAADIAAGMAGNSAQLRSQCYPVLRHGQLEDAWFDVDYVPVRDETGQIAGVLWTLKETTEQVLAERTVLESEARHRLLIESWTQAVWETDPEGVVVADSPSWRAYTGQTVEQWLGYGWLNAIHPDDRAFAERQWREAMAVRGVVNAEFRLRSPDGGWRWTNVRAAPTRDEAGAIQKWVGMNVDIDARKRAEAALHESEEKYRSLFDTVRQGLAINQLVRNEDGRVIDARYLDLNPAYEAQTGFERAEAIGRLASEIFPLIEPFWLEMAERVVESGQPERIERFVADTGSWFAFDMAAFGGADRFIVLFDDITERKQAEQALHEGEERQAFLLKLSDTLRATPDDAIVDRAIGMLSDELGLDLCYAVTVQQEEDRADVLHQLRRRSDMPGVPAVIRLSDYPQAFLEWQERTLVSEDMANDSALTDVDRRNVAAMQFGALIAAPVRRGAGHPIWSIIAVMARPRRWTASEIALVEETAERTWSAVERARAEAALRESEERQVFLLKLSDAIRPLVDVADVQATATRLLGEHLNVDRSMYAEVTGEPGAEAGAIRGQYIRLSAPGRPAPTPFPDHFTYETFGADVMSRRYKGEGLAVADVNGDPDFDPADRAAWAAVGVRAAIVAPLVKGGRLVAEVGVHSETPRIWTDAEIRLVHEVGERTWAAAERARAEAALHESEERYRSLFESMGEAYAVVDVLKDETGTWADFRFVEVNPAFLAHTSMPWPVGKTATELLGSPNPRWTQLYGQALDSGEAIRVEEAEPILGRIFDLNIFVLDRSRHRVAVLFTNITERKHAEAALRDSEQWLQTLMKGVPQLVWRAVDGGHWTWASPQWTAFTGQTEAASHDWGWLEPVHPDDRGAVKEKWESARERGTFEADHRICDIDEKRYRWFQTRGTPVRDDTGTIIEWLGTSTDIDDLRTLQERQTVLVTELQHRTFNLMGMIRSLADATIKSSDDLTAFKSNFSDRIDALARVQRLLSRLADDARVSFGDLIHGELDAVGALPHDDPRVTLTGPHNVLLRSSTVQTIAMAVHELTTNAVKYGALSQPNASLSIYWHVDTGADGTPWLHLDWHESGVEMPPRGAAPRGTGQGRKLIEGALRYQLRARTTYVMAEDGVRCSIILPVSDRTQKE